MTGAIGRSALVLALCLGAPSSLRAEVLDGPVDLREGAERKPAAHLEDRIRVDAAVARGEWVTVGFFVVVAADACPDNGYCTLKAGHDLVGADGRKLGTVTGEISTEGAFTDQTSGKHMTYVSGVVPAKAVRVDTSVELAMANILNEKKGPIVRADLDAHLRAFPYEPWFDQGDLTSFYIPDLPYPSGGRFFVLFYKDQLAAVIFHRRMPLKLARPTKSTRAGSWMYVEKLSPAIRKEMEGCYLPIIAKAN
jgi:hypothetical protein